MSAAVTFTALKGTPDQRLPGPDDYSHRGTDGGDIRVFIWAKRREAQVNISQRRADISILLDAAPLRVFAAQLLAAADHIEAEIAPGPGGGGRS